MSKRPSPVKQPDLTRKQVSRARRESRIQRAVLIGTAVVALAVIGLIVFAVLNEQVLKPRRVLATVGDDKITVTQFQQRARFDYYLDYYLQSGGMTPDQLGIDPTLFGQFALDSLIADRVLLKKAAELGIAVSDEEVQEQVELLFGYDSGDPEPTPTIAPSPTGPTLAPTATPTFVYTLTPRPTATLEPGVTPTLLPTATSTPSGPPTATPTPAPTATPEPVAESDFQENLTSLIDSVTEMTGIPAQRARELLYERTKLTLIRERLVEALDLPADETKTLVHAAHILVDTQEEAIQVLERLTAGEPFEVVSAEVSRDSSNAYKGGDLGWFGRGAMVEPFEEAAFSLPVGEISGPVQSDFGWHIIKVYDRQDVPTTAGEQEEQRQSKFREMLSEWREEYNVTIDDVWEDFVPPLP
jgi:parvulin-like peptidyl-prolyl isomerase